MILTRNYYDVFFLILNVYLNIFNFFHHSNLHFIEPTVRDFIHTFMNNYDFISDYCSCIYNNFIDS